MRLLFLAPFSCDRKYLCRDGLGTRMYVVVIASGTESLGAAA